MIEPYSIFIPTHPRPWLNLTTDTASTAMELFGSILGVGLCVFVMYHLRASCRQVIARFKNYRSTDGE